MSLDPNLNKTLLYGICHMLLTAQTQAEWNLGLDFGETAEPVQKSGGRALGLKLTRRHCGLRHWASFTAR